ncbi:MAG: hypothetical protein MK078_04850 [Crocinitomicaceae bacterium]|nr:hypothetical protein [Crocinitomicaceae bacterium]
MKSTLILLIGLFAVNTSLSQILEFKKIEKTNIPLSSLWLEKKGEIEVESFEISEQVKVYQYKYYLRSIREDSSLAFYKSQLPDSAAIFPISVNDYLTDYSYRNLPISGVNWQQALNFSKWLNHVETHGEFDSYYLLPTINEWTAASIKFPEEFNSHYKDWTINTYDESTFDLLENPGLYIYKALEHDPPSMKRKIIATKYLPEVQTQNSLGKNYRYEYMDSSNFQIGFRLVRTNSLLRIYRPLENQGYYYGKKSNGTLWAHTKEGILYTIKKSNRLKNGIFSKENVTSSNKIIEGEYYYNQRKGIWNRYNEKGELIVSRLYYSNTEFSDLLKEKTYNVFLAQLNDQFSKPGAERRNELFIYDFVREADVYSSKRLWRQISLDSNSILKENWPELLNEIKSSIEKENLVVYGKKSDQFKNVLTKKEGLALFDSEVKITGFIIKEDHFLDRKRNVADVRIIGLAPVMTNGNKLCWFYYPQFRQTLSKIQVNKMYFQHLEDVFHFRFFNSEIIKESGLYEKEMKGSSIEKEVYLIDYQNQALY